MTTWRKIMHTAMDALDIPQTGGGGSVTPHSGTGRAIVRQPGGYVVELLSEPLSVCPHCHKAIPRPATRRRRLVQVVAGGRVLSVEIDP